MKLGCVYDADSNKAVIGFLDDQGHYHFCVFNQYTYAYCLEMLDVNEVSNELASRCRSLILNLASTLGWL